MAARAQGTPKQQMANYGGLGSCLKPEKQPTQKKSLNPSRLHFENDLRPLFKINWIISTQPLARVQGTRARLGQADALVYLGQSYCNWSAPRTFRIVPRWSQRQGFTKGCCPFLHPMKVLLHFKENRMILATNAAYYPWRSCLKSKSDLFSPLSRASSHVMARDGEGGVEKRETWAPLDVQVYLACSQRVVQALKQHIPFHCSHSEGSGQGMIYSGFWSRLTERYDNNFLPLPSRYTLICM